MPELRMLDSALAGPALRRFAGCALQPQSLQALLQKLLPRLTAGAAPLLVGHHNLYSLYLQQRDPEVAAFYRQCDSCYVDGVPVLWLLRAAGIDIRGAQRFSFMDCLPELLDFAQTGKLRVFYLGSEDAAIERAQGWVAKGWPQLEIAWQHGYSKDEAAVVAAINAFRPQLLLVGMGMPKQEQWILRHRAQLQAGAIFQAGGTLDYYTGLQAQPPAGLSRLGLAWLYRLLHDPKRLWRRYLLTPWALLRPTLRLRRELRAERRLQRAA
ncbi:WecB/TagA/CpsF family glycosyltransferase [Haliea sp. E1-2-M8]|uniref:WecB/TagA/CpsF family glycosyltransferase n=1 Tax=Haliea sp. E1-2-M8 TaxID=3064706 RepID=UPI00272411E4|nr:WecB/TagA/CpsF family glycosyltransferase [Haliea sp. E1-2-M8]MDO8862439.1 WecB/TagA/CpsF family glycosyltransferase [Haliea sp. E1-2-M8]